MAASAPLPIQSLHFGPRRFMAAREAELEKLAFEHFEVRRLAPVIAAVRGSQESLGGWKKAYRAALAGELPKARSAGVVLPLPPSWQSVVHDEWGSGTVLPWGHLDGPLSQEKLQEHRQQALSLG